MGRGGKPIHRICADSSQDESLLPLKWKESQADNVSPSNRLALSWGLCFGLGCWWVGSLVAVLARSAMAGEDLALHHC